MALNTRVLVFTQGTAKMDLYYPNLGITVWGRDVKGEIRGAAVPDEMGT